MEHIQSIIAAIQEWFQQRDSALLIQAFRIDRKIPEGCNIITCRLLNENGKCFAEFKYSTASNHIGRVRITDSDKDNILRARLWCSAGI